ncbi:MAG: VapE domain-containing protein [bacterium]
MINSDMISVAMDFRDKYNLNPLPTIPREKRPGADNWKELQTRKLDDTEIVKYFGNIDTDEVRIGIVCGQVSGNLEVIDFDNKLGNIEQTFDEYSNFPGIKSILIKCVIEKTQSDGYHIFYRCDEIEGNQKLAMVKNGGKPEAIIETRGEGGYCVCSPSKGYELIQGDFSNILEITVEERESLLSSARSFDQTIKPISLKNTSGLKFTSDKPWELFNNDPEMLNEAKNLLSKNGWSLEYSNDEHEYWKRPGKNDPGISASFNETFFYVFSTNAYPFEANRAYTPFAIYTYLNYGTESDDFKKATLDIIDKGYGELKGDKSKIPVIEEVEVFLSARYDFQFNDVTGRLEFKRKSEEEFKNIEDYELASMYRELQHEEISFSYDRLNTLLNSDFVPKVDPFKNYFDGLNEWDGEDYIKQLGDTVKLSDENLRDYWNTCLRKYLIGVVACAINPKATNEAALILSGSQGIGKTKWLNRLVPNELDPDKYLFVGTIYNNNKDSQLYLSTKLIINLDELQSLNYEEIGYLKSLFSLQSISLREPYLRKSRAYHRRASFVGSVDREEFLNDLTGTRRFLCFEIHELDYVHNVDMNKVYAQAKYLYQSGERYYFDLEDIKNINEKNEEFRIRSIEEELFFKYFKKPTENNYSSEMTTSEIALVLNGIENNLKITDKVIRKLGQILKANGFQKKSSRKNSTSRKAWVVQRYSF